MNSGAVVDISIVVPIYNEEEGIEFFCQQVHAALSAMDESYEVLLIDDGSTDHTWKIMCGLTTKIPHLRLIRFRRNFGQTAAMSAGFHESRGKVIITLDADMQNDPADIPLLLEKLTPDTDVVSGWRKERKDPFVSRRLPSIIANSLIARITGVPLHDFGCTLKAYRHEVIQNIQLYGEMHRFIPALASWVGGHIEEVPVGHQPRQYGHSKYGISRTIRVILDLITVKFLLRYSMGPMQIFGKIGGLFGVPGLLLLLFMVVANGSYHLFGTEFGAELIKRPFWMMSSFMLIFLGMQFISMGLLAEVQTRTYHEAQNKRTYVIRETLDSEDIADGNTA